MATKVFDKETWNKLGQPNINSKMYYINKSTSKKVWGLVSEIDFGHKKGIKLKITPFKSIK
jgi:hypothetical protein